MLYLFRKQGGGVQSKVGIMQARDSTSGFFPLELQFSEFYTNARAFSQMKKM